LGFGVGNRLPLALASAIPSPCDAGGLEDDDRQRPAGAALVVVDRSDGGQALPELLVLGVGGDPWPDVSALVVQDGDTLSGGLEVEPPAGR
jgi:hypothetical protein